MWNPIVNKLPQLNSIEYLDILLTEIGSQLHVDYLGYEVIFQIDKKTYRDKRIFKLIGNDGNDCLKIIIINANNEDGIIGEIDWVTNKFSDMTKGGTWLVNLADTFIKGIGCKRATLIDAAMIKCNYISASLIFVRIYSGVFSSWYQNFGFIPVKDVTAQMKELYSLPNEFEIPELPAISGETLGPYMHRLFQFDCELYHQVQTEIMQTDLGFEIVTHNRYYKDY